MSREIKFRAWHESDKEMVNFNNEKLCNDEYQRLHLAYLLAGKYGGALMQFTGLRDVNGVEIYEGDVVEPIEGGGLSLVQQKNGCWVFESCENLFEYAGQIEVMGNIHEHPHLLDEAK